MTHSTCIHGRPPTPGHVTRGAAHHGCLLDKRPTVDIDRYPKTENGIKFLEAVVSVTVWSNGFER